MTIQSIPLSEYKKAETHAKVEDIRLKRYEEQEAKRAKLVQIDQPWVLWVWIGGVFLGFVASAIISFNGITSVAPLVGLSEAWMSMLFFFIVEFLYLLFLIAFLLLDSRAEGYRWVVVGMVYFASVAILGNAYHTFSYHEWDLMDAGTWAGVVLSVSAPVAILSLSKLASRVVFAKAVRID